MIGGKCHSPASNQRKSSASGDPVLAPGVALDHTVGTTRRSAQLMKIIALLVLAAFFLWLQPWADATARSHFGRFESAHSGESTARCPSGYRKSTITARCVRNTVRLPTWFW